MKSNIQKPLIYGCSWSTVKQRIYENPELLGS